MATADQPEGSSPLAGPPSGIARKVAKPDGARRREHPLLSYGLRRVAAGVALVFVLSVVIFAAMTVLPGDVATTVLGKNATPEQVQALTEEFHLDEPFPKRYVRWVSGFFTGDLGTSVANHQPVADVLKSRVSNTLQFALLAIAILLPLAIVLGVVSALKPGRVVDQLVSGVSLLGISFPDFVVATFVAWIFGIVLGLFPPVALVAPGASPLETPAILVLPILTMVIIGTPYTSRMVRAGMLDVLGAEYIQTARLKGIAERRVIWWHALRNALGPTVQIVAATLQWLIGGVIAVEIVFNYPGIGSELVRSVQIRDINFVQSTALAIATVFIFVNIAADILVMLLVPKLRSSQQ